MTILLNFNWGYFNLSVEREGVANLLVDFTSIALISPFMKETKSISYLFLS